MPFSWSSFGGTKPHSATHIDGGSDELDSPLNVGATATPKPHSATHIDGGSDEIDSLLDVSAIPIIDEIDLVVSDILKASADAQITVNSTTLTKTHTITIPANRSGALRIAHQTVTGTGTLESRIYRNGSDNPVGILRNTIDSFSEDIAGWSPGDTVELWCRMTAGGVYAYAKNFRIYADESISYRTDW